MCSESEWYNDLIIRPETKDELTSREDLKKCTRATKLDGKIVSLFAGFSVLAYALL